MIVGTAGHVDHGKTSLVKALTGVDTDRLPEEKRRGITLELGFAAWALPSGRRVGVVDVPGHERFVRAMVAGAGGVDVALLVIAADEGVMPQTREHVDICGLLGVTRGVVAITKSDLLPGLPPEWRELLEADVAALVRGSFFEAAPLHFVSVRTGEGLVELAQTVDRLTAGAEVRAADGPLFLPVDRAFSVKGFGCVVTGSLTSGALRVDDEVLLSPDGRRARVRGLEVHGARVAEVRAGSRVAANLQGVETAEVRRGSALVRPGELAPVRALDVELTLLSSSPAALPARSRRLVSVGTETRLGVVQLLGQDRLEPGETGYAQLRFGAPVAALPHQRFVLRGTESAPGRGATQGGGRVLVLGPRRRRRDGAAQVAAFAAGGLDERLGALLDAAGYTGALGSELEAQAAAPKKDVLRALEVGAAQGRWALVDKDARRFVSSRLLAALEAKLVATVAAVHDAAPERDGVGREELWQRCGAPLERSFARALAAAVAKGQLEQLKELVRVPGRGRSFSTAAQAQQDALVAALERGGLSPPTVAELGAALALPPTRVSELLQALVTAGAVVRADTLFFHARPIAELKARLLAHLAAHGEVTTQGFKELTQVSRKYLIPLAEYFDATKVTLRVGERRVARKRD